MADPVRLLDDPNASNEAVALLRSLSAPEPFSASASAGIAAKVAETVAHAPVAATAVKATTLKLAAGAAVVGAGSLALWFSLAEVPPSEPAPAPRAVPVAAAPAAPSLPEPPAAAPDVVEPAPEPRLVERAPQRAPSARDSLAVEEALLEQARKAAAASPARALSLLREHERRFPRGELAAERLFLSAKAQAASGNQAAARRYAAELERRFPSSSYNARLKATLAAPPAKP